MISALHLLIFLFTRLKHLTLNPFNHFTPNPHRRDDNDHTPNTSYFTLHNLRHFTLHTSGYTTSSLSPQATSRYTTLHIHTTYYTLNYSSHFTLPPLYTTSRYNHLHHFIHRFSTFLHKLLYATYHISTYATAQA